jgi:hypothetical protein
LRVELPKKMTTEQYVARFNAEKAALQRHYCTVFKFWLACPFKPCRKSRACRGEQYACLKRSIERVPRDIQFQARQRIMEATPATADPPERMAREFLAGGFCG